MSINKDTDRKLLVKLEEYVHAGLRGISISRTEVSVINGTHAQEITGHTIFLSGKTSLWDMSFCKISFGSSETSIIGIEFSNYIQTAMLKAHKDIKGTFQVISEVDNECKDRITKVLLHLEDSYDFKLPDEMWDYL